MSQRRSYSNSNDFNLDDLFRPEPAGAGQPGQPGQPQAPGQPPMPQAGPTQVLPPQAPQQQAMPPQAQAMPPHAAAVDPALATQYLPPYPTSDPNAGAAPQQQPYPGPQQSVFAAQSAQPAQPAPPVQPGYPAQPAGPAPSAFPAQPPFPAQPGYGGQPAPGYGGQGYGVQQPSYQPEYAGSDDDGRPSQKLIIGGVVAGCAVAGILIAVLMSGDDKHTDQTPVAKTSSAPASAGANGAPDQAQAKALSDLLGKAKDSRQAVISAVESVKKCADQANAQNALTQAAAQRDNLVTELGSLKVDKLPNGPQLAEALKNAWQASSNADKEYAAWAGDSLTGCDPSKQNANPHAKNGDAASGTATQAKTQASDLWNTIATAANLPKKDKSEL